MKIAQLSDAIPIVATTTERAAKYPSPDVNQRVHNLQTASIDRWNGSAWVSLPLSYLTGDIGVDTLTATDTVGPQLAARYDANNKVEITVDSAGTARVEGTGAGKQWRVDEMTLAVNHATQPLLTLDVADTTAGLLTADGSDVTLQAEGTRTADVNTGGAVRFRIPGSSPGAGAVWLLVYDQTAGALVQVTRGDADSGGSGFRALRIPN